MPGASPLHTMNAQVKIILACVFSVVGFLVQTWAGMGVLLALTVCLYAVSRVPLGHALAGLKPVVVILLFTVVVHMFTGNVNDPTLWTQGASGSLGLPQTIALAGAFGLTLDGFVQGLFFALRIALLIAMCALLTFTTSMVGLTDALLRLMSPLRVLRVPVDDVAMIVSIALRFIPTTVEEARAVSGAQKARCADFDAGNVFVRMKAWIPVLVPLFVRLFRRADELAQAMDTRCYVGEGRTSVHESQMRPSDIAALLVGCAVLIALAVLL